MAEHVEVLIIGAGISGIGAACYLENWFAYANGRAIEEAEDVCAVQALDRGLAETGYALNDVLLSLVDSPSFTHRLPEE